MSERRPCPRAFNEKERVYGFAPGVLSGVFVVFALLMLLPISKAFAVMISAFALVAAFWYAKFETEIGVFARALFQSARYTPEKRTIVRLEIK